MARLNVEQPDGGNAIFNTVTDEFVEFDADTSFADSIEWNDALRHAIGACMGISEGVEKAISLGLVSREECEAILKKAEKEFIEDNQEPPNT